MNEKYKHVYKVFLKGSKEALAQAYRDSLDYFRVFARLYGDDDIPSYFIFKFVEIEGFHVISFLSDRSGYYPSYEDISGIEQRIWIHYDENVGVASTNDVDGLIINRKEFFGIPEADYKVITDSDVTLDSETSKFYGLE